MSDVKRAERSSDEQSLGFTGRVAGWSARYGWAVVAGTLVVLVIAILLNIALGVKTTEVFGAGDSRHGQLLIEDRFEETEPLAELILFSNPSLDVDHSSFVSTVDSLVTELKELKGVASVTSYYDTGLEFMVSEDRHVLMVRLLFEPGDSDELLEFVEPVISAVQDANERASDDGFEIEQFGDTSANKAFDDVILEDFEKVTLTALVGGLIIMILAFGAVVAAVIPLIMAMTAIFLTIGAAVLVSQVYALQEFYVQLVLLMGLAVGIDYSLFIINRFREERAAGRSKPEAIQIASNTTPSPLGLLGRDLEPFQPPDPLHLLVVHSPPITSQQGTHPAVPITSVPAGQLHQRPREGLLVIGYCYRVPLCSPGLRKRPAGAPFGDAIPLLYQFHALPSAGRAQKFPRAASFRIWLSTVRSATARLRRAFSPSISRNRFAWSTLSPPYSRRQR